MLRRLVSGAIERAGPAVSSRRNQVARRLRRSRSGPSAAALVQSQLSGAVRTNMTDCSFRRVCRHERASERVCFHYTQAARPRGRLAGGRSERLRHDLRGASRGHGADRERRPTRACPPLTPAVSAGGSLRSDNSPNAAAAVTNSGPSGGGRHCDPVARRAVQRIVGFCTGGHPLGFAGHDNQCVGCDGDESGCGFVAGRGHGHKCVQRRECERLGVAEAVSSSTRRQRRVMLRDLVRRRCGRTLVTKEGRSIQSNCR